MKPKPRRLEPRVVCMLPADVRNALVEASRVDPENETSTRRAAAINKAVEAARTKYPNLFSKEK